MKVIVLLLAILCASSAWASTARIDGRIVSVGMSSAEVRERAGAPVTTERVENRFGAKVADRWEYHEGRRVINLYMSQGKLVHIEEL